jgi:hypothetical protein
MIHIRADHCIYNDHGLFKINCKRSGSDIAEVRVAVVVTAASGFDLGYVWKNQAGLAEPERTAGGYYINAVQGASRRAGGVALVPRRWGSAKAS